MIRSSFAGLHRRRSGHYDWGASVQDIWFEESNFQNWVYHGSTRDQFTASRDVKTDIFEPRRVMVTSSVRLVASIGVGILILRT